MRYLTLAEFANKIQRTTKHVQDYIGAKHIDGMFYDGVRWLIREDISLEDWQRKDTRFSNNNDILEDDYLKLDGELLNILLKDHSSKKNLIWATDIYKEYGEGFSFFDEITPEKITGSNGNVIRPRVNKALSEQRTRSREKAEVFTPAWICNKQNNLVDNAWFERENIFNFEQETKWQTIRKRIRFPKGKTYIDYIKSTRLEITCGEAPYLTSRYDAVSGEGIPVRNRIGFLDRKLRVVSEAISNNTMGIEQKKVLWIELAKDAVKSCYGFDFQGDNVLLARENLLKAMNDAFMVTFKEDLPIDIVKEYAYIISWNIWQMDGLKYVVPESCGKVVREDIFGEIEAEPCLACLGKGEKHNGIYCRIMNWEVGKEELFVSSMENNR